MKFEEVLPALRKGKMIKDNAGYCYRYTKRYGIERYKPKEKGWYPDSFDERVVESSFWEILPDDMAEKIRNPEKILYTVKITKEDGKVIYPSKISLGNNIIEPCWTEFKELAVWWEEYDCADTFAREYNNAEIVKKDKEAEIIEK